MSCDLICVYPAQVNQFWPFVEPLLKAATERCGEWSIGEIRRELDRGALLWITAEGPEVKAACVTRLIKNHDGLICQALACGGEDDDWRTTFEPIEDYARNEGCVKTQIAGRQGWARIFKDYDIAWITLEKRLDS